MNKTLFTYWRSHILPSPAALALVSVAGAFIGLGLACSTLYGVSAATTFADGMGRFAFTFGFLTMPLAALPLLAAAARDRRSLPRGLVIGGAALVVLLGGLLTSLGIGSSAGSPFVISAATFLFFFVPLAILLLGVALYFAARGLPELRADIAADRERRAIQMIEARGEVALADLASELGGLFGAPQIKSVESELSVVYKQQSKVISQRKEIDGKIQGLTQKLNHAKVEFAKLESEINDSKSKIESNTKRLAEIIEESSKLHTFKSRLESIITNHKDTISELRGRIAEQTGRHGKIEHDMDELNIILEKAAKAAAQYDAKIKIVKSIMHEDYTIANLKEHREELGIEGQSYEMMSWDKEYERAILAAGSDWIKAFVVKDFRTLLSLAEVARAKKLPKLKIIPLEAIPKFSLTVPSDSDVLGVLSDYVRCDARYAPLATFLFGNVLLVKNQDADATVLQDMSYRWDVDDNLIERADLSRGLVERVSYDNRSRLDYVAAERLMVLDLAYDEVGNIVYKSDVGNYSYDPVRRHAVVATGSNRYAYDANGNVATANGSTVSWYSYDLPNTIFHPGGNYSAFYYRPDRERYRHVARDGSMLIADIDSHRIRRVSPTGTMSTLAGTGETWSLRSPRRRSAPA